MIHRVRILTLLVAGTALTSCGGDPIPTGPGPDPDDPEPEMIRVVLQRPSFQVDVQEIFVRKACTDSNCHGDGQGALFLRPDSRENYANIVNVRALQESEFLLVEPFDATNSYLIIRLEDRQRTGLARMPPFGQLLDSIDLTNLRNWINNGAPRN